jgi:hypothetical protein
LELASDTDVIGQDDQELGRDARLYQGKEVTPKEAGSDSYPHEASTAPNRQIALITH